MFFKNLLFLLLCLSAHSSQCNLLLHQERLLDQEEMQLQQKLRYMAGIQTDAQWQKLQKSVYDEYLQACTESTHEERTYTPLSNNIIQPIIKTLSNEQIVRKLGIARIKLGPDNLFVKAYMCNGNIITIAKAKDSFPSEAGVDQYNVLINEKELFSSHKTDSEIQATLAHELMHIAKQDDFNLYCLCQAPVKKKKRKFNRIKAQWERLQEKRADILSGLIDRTYAPASRDQFRRIMKKREKARALDTHPTISKRFEYMSQLTDAMKQNNLQIWQLLFAIAFLALFSPFALNFTRKNHKAI